MVEQPLHELRGLSEEELRKIKAYLERYSDIVAVYVFGSVAKGKARKGSDLDLGVLFASDIEGQGSLEHFDLTQKMAADLEEMINRPVDVVDIRKSSWVLQSQVLRYGKLLLEVDHKARVAYEVRFRREYFDFKPVLEAYSRKRISAIIDKDSGRE